MPTTGTPDKSKILEYNAKHRVLICRECRYAVQKSALGSHLLRHKIYRRDRQELLSSTERIDLVEPDDVALPSPGSAPVDGLPVFDGLKCMASSSGCQHLTVSLKRMKHHWATQHDLDDESGRAGSFVARPVMLQTFFRGNKTKYFEVASRTRSLTLGEGDDAEGIRIDEQDYDGIVRGDTTVPIIPQPSQPPPVPIERRSDSSLTDFDLDTLNDFHHFITIVAPTLPTTECLPHTLEPWANRLVNQALRCHWLMCGLLAVSAHHQAYHSENQTHAQDHRIRRIEYTSRFFDRSSATTGHDTDPVPADTAAEIELSAKRISCILYCVQWAWTEPSTLDQSATTVELSSILSNIRGCVAGVDVANGRLDNFPTDKTGRTPTWILNELNTLPSRLAERLGKPETKRQRDDVFAALSAVSLLIKHCNVSFSLGDPSTAASGVTGWLDDVPEHFNRMVSDRHTAALVVLAYWAAILVRRAERAGACWFLDGLAKGLVLRIRQELFDSTSRADLVLVDGPMEWCI